MNNQFEDGIIEFQQKNFEKALKHFEEIERSDEQYELSLPYRISCLMKFDRYSEALTFINSSIEKDPYDEILWFDKAFCHIFLKEEEKARSAMETIERIVDAEDASKLVQVARLYSLLLDDSKVIEYADKALAIDENCKEALYEKMTALVNSDDKEMIDDVSNRLVEISDGNLLSLMPAFLLKLFSKDYRGCIDLLNNSVPGDFGDESIEMFKSLIYNNLSDDLNAKLLVTQQIEISVDDALELMLEFKETGKDFGKIRGVQYFIL